MADRDPAHELADQLYRQSVGVPAEVAIARMAEALRAQRAEGREEGHALEKAWQAQPATRCPMAIDFEAEARAWLSRFGRMVLDDPEDHDSLAAEYRRMHKAGQREGYDFAATIEALRADQRIKLLALAERWERRAGNGRLALLPTERSKLRMCANDLRVVLEGDS